jgi:SAM-dependent methyltransferase
MNFTLAKPLYDLDERIKFTKSLPQSAKLLDIGIGKGDVIRIFLTYRPDIEIYGIDIVDQKKFLPAVVHFSVANVVLEKLDFPDNYFDAVSVIHVIEHLNDLSNFFSEVFRVLKPGGAFYIETPSEKTTHLPKFAGWFPDKTGGPINFYDDDSHIRPWSPAILRAIVSGFPLSNIKIGTYRNFLYTLLSPLLLLSGLILRKRRMFVVGLNHMIGWSVFFRGRKRNR